MFVSLQWCVQLTQSVGFYTPLCCYASCFSFVIHTFDLGTSVGILAVVHGEKQSANKRKINHSGCVFYRDTVNTRFIFTPWEMHETRSAPEIICAELDFSHGLYTALFNVVVRLSSLLGLCVQFLAGVLLFVPTTIFIIIAEMIY